MADYYEIRIGYGTQSEWLEDVFVNLDDAFDKAKKLCRQYGENRVSIIPRKRAIRG